jgi:hypothetical protein
MVGKRREKAAGSVSAWLVGSAARMRDVEGEEVRDEAGEMAWKSSAWTRGCRDWRKASNPSSAAGEGVRVGGRPR